MAPNVLQFPQHESNAKAKILCLDDEPVGLFVRQTLLELSGYTVLSATTADDALRILAEEPVDLVVADYSLGNISGTAVAESMKHMKPNVPIMILSGWDEPPGGLGHADQFLCKTEPPSVLLDTIASMLVHTAAKTA
jgi:CheY-like chemotaxis protein